LEELRSSEKPIDIICITEHNMKPGDDEQLFVSNYNLASCYSRENRNGGSCILVKNCHKYVVLTDVLSTSITNVFECSAIELKEHKIIVICIYRPPKLDNFAIDIFLNRLNVIFSKICYRSKKIIVCGDFNIDTLKRTKHSLQFKNLILGYNLRLGITEPTRLQSKTCIDNILHNIRGGKTEVMDFAISDHTAQILKCPVKKTYLLPYWFIKKRNYSAENISKFVECLQSLNFNSSYMANDPNEAFECFIDDFQLFYNLCFPLVRYKISTFKKPKWITKGIRICCRKKRNLLWKYRLSPTTSGKNHLKVYSNRLKKIILLTQKAQNDYYIKNSVNKCKATWNIIKNPKSTHLRENITLVKHDGIRINDTKAIAQTFNEHFVEQITSNNNADIICNNPNSTSKNNLTMTFKSSNSIFMKPTCPHDIYTIINSLKNTNSTGFDGISCKIVKRVAHIISPIISYITNLCIETGRFPEILKIAVVKPLFKKGDKENVNDYRPIALLSIFSKIIEKVIYNSLYQYFETRDLFAAEQKGFRKNKSINMAIFDLLQKVMKELNEKKPAVALYMDMSKAFDFVDHNILLNKLYNYGVRGNVHDLIRSYMTGRKQMVTINKICTKSKKEISVSSDLKEIKYGVPQGSVLGPLLFLIYINDLPLTITEHSMILFADDSTIIFTGNDTQTLQNEINKAVDTVITWLNMNNLCINLNKTKIMKFKQRVDRIPNLVVTYKNHQIDESDLTKFLGLSIDNKLTFKDQIDIICKKLNKFSYALYNLRKIVGQPAVLTAYHAYVTSTLRYGVMFWGNSTDREMAFKAQKRCLRSVCKIPSTESCKTHFVRLSILTLPCLYIFETAVYVKNNMNQFSVFNSARRCHKIYTRSTKTAFLAKSIFGMAPKIYNKLPKNLSKLEDLVEFKKSLFTLLIKKAYYSLNEYLTDCDL
jgi:hypothetical protein